VGVERFRINRPDVIHEILDDELVVVNLRSGAYFSLDRIGAVVWQAIERHASVPDMRAELAARYEGEEETIERELERLLGDLRRENLIVPHEGNGAVEAAPAPIAEPRTPFGAPVLQKYTDMQELLLLDPIHEVDETGWPTRGS
jgi:hypothetical protein